jgi:hypothetical protein
VLVGATAERFLDYIVFEREAKYEDPGQRHLLADVFETGKVPALIRGVTTTEDVESRVARMEREFELSREQVLELIDSAPRLKMAVRGWVAEEHLRVLLSETPGVTECVQLEEDGKPDFRIRYKGRGPILIECKNVLRKTDRQGLAKLEFQKTRAAKSDPCSRYYLRSYTDVAAGCMNAVTGRWDYRLKSTAQMAPHTKCQGHLNHNIRIDESWTDDVEQALDSVI